MADGEIEGTVAHRIRKFREGSFDQHAALEAIDCAIRDADAAQSKLGRHLAWLQDVKARRKQEIKEGKWPVADEHQELIKALRAASVEPGMGYLNRAADAIENSTAALRRITNESVDITTPRKTLEALDHLRYIAKVALGESDA